MRLKRFKKRAELHSDDSRVEPPPFSRLIHAYLPNITGKLYIVHSSHPLSSCAELRQPTWPSESLLICATDDVADRGH
jgi:hypothetical protein